MLIDISSINKAFIIIQTKHKKFVLLPPSKVGKVTFQKLFLRRSELASKDLVLHNVIFCIATYFGSR